jgi:hypothetical protein
VERPKPTFDPQDINLLVPDNSIHSPQKNTTVGCQQEFKLEEKEFDANSCGTVANTEVKNKEK